MLEAFTAKFYERVIAAGTVVPEGELSPMRPRLRPEAPPGERPPAAAVVSSELFFDVGLTQAAMDSLVTKKVDDRSLPSGLSDLSESDDFDGTAE